MPKYSDPEYWTKRYGEEYPDPYDWLISFNHLKDLLEELIPDKNSKILAIGCGNANFSPDLYDAGYTNLINADNCKVVIMQQKERRPDMVWVVDDASKSKFEDLEFDIIIDKSLIDTLVCFQDKSQVVNMLKENHRLLKPGGRYITISLHSMNDCEKYLPSHETIKVKKSLLKGEIDPLIDPFERIKDFHWSSSLCELPNPKFDEMNPSNYAVCHTFIVTDKWIDDKGTLAPGVTYPYDLTKFAIDENEKNYKIVLAESAKVYNIIEEVELDELTERFDRALEIFQIAREKTEKMLLHDFEHLSHEEDEEAIEEATEERVLLQSTIDGYGEIIVHKKKDINPAEKYLGTTILSVAE